MTTSAASAAPALLFYVYTSWSTDPFDDEALAALLETSRRNNAAVGLTGLLLYRDGHFLQLLEGPPDEVRARMTVIAADPRHMNVRVLLEDDTDERQFPEWTMGYERVDAERAPAIPGYRETFDDLEQGDEFDRPASIRALRALMSWFRDRASA